MHHLVERPPENSYGKLFVIFQVILPLQFFFILQIMQILATLVREFLANDVTLVTSYGYCQSLKINDRRTYVRCLSYDL